MVSARLYAMRREVAETIRLPPGLLNEDLLSHPTARLGPRLAKSATPACSRASRAASARSCAISYARESAPSKRGRSPARASTPTNRSRAMAGRTRRYRRLSWKAKLGKVFWLPLRLYVELRARLVRPDVARRELLDERRLRQAHAQAGAKPIVTLARLAPALTARRSEPPGSAGAPPRSAGRALRQRPPPYRRSGDDGGRARESSSSASSPTSGIDGSNGWWRRRRRVDAGSSRRRWKLRVFTFLRRWPLAETRPAGCLRTTTSSPRASRAPSRPAASGVRKRRGSASARAAACSPRWRASFADSTTPGSTRAMPTRTIFSCDRRRQGIGVLPTRSRERSPCTRRVGSAPAVKNLVQLHRPIRGAVGLRDRLHFLRVYAGRPLRGAARLAATARSARREKGS